MRAWRVRSSLLSFTTSLTDEHVGLTLVRDMSVPFRVLFSGAAVFLAWPGDRLGVPSWGGGE